MKLKLCLSAIVIISFLWNNAAAFDNAIVNKKIGFAITLPDNIQEKSDSTADGPEVSYYDPHSDVYLIISERSSKFERVEDYMDCSKKDLEKQLRYFADDSTLQLINCVKSSYYPGESVILHFKTQTAPYGLNGNFIYFLHHNDRDIQLTFMYNTANQKTSMDYIDVVMQTFKLLDKKNRR